MISKKSQNKISSEDFNNLMKYFGISIHSQTINHKSVVNPQLNYIDIEEFFLAATYNLKTSRLTEGVLCWILKFGHLLSPSKIRRLIQTGYFFDSTILGGFISFLIENKIQTQQWRIITPFCRKRKKLEPLFNGPTPRKPASYFLKYRILTPQFQFEENKFLRPIVAIYKNCIELKNRALFGSVVNADTVSYLTKHPGSTPYQIAKNTHHHKARVFDVYEDILEAS
ncbi:MAG TPA: hypothetical protein PLJ21_10550 [Pseudobdellovibrionaceae bacterium]|nr:hypothetical protein [Pseudobdellovibrionaceae bacterium]